MAQVPFIRTPALAWVLGALTLWPHVYVVGFVVTLALRVVTGGSGPAFRRRRGWLLSLRAIDGA